MTLAAMKSVYGYAGKFRPMPFIDTEDHQEGNGGWVQK